MDLFGSPRSGENGIDKCETSCGGLKAIVILDGNFDITWRVVDRDRNVCMCDLQGMRIVLTRIILNTEGWIGGDRTE
jgi:hypothetical protein